MSNSHALQHILATEIPRAFARSPLFHRELRRRMRTAALQWQEAFRLREWEQALEALDNARAWRDMAEDCAEISSGALNDLAQGDGARYERAWRRVHSNSPRCAPAC